MWFWYACTPHGRGQYRPTSVWQNVVFGTYDFASNITWVNFIGAVGAAIWMRDVMRFRGPVGFAATVTLLLLLMEATNHLVTRAVENKRVIWCFV